MNSRLRSVLLPRSASCMFVCAVCAADSGATPAGIGVPFPEVAFEDRVFVTSLGDLNGDGRDDHAIPVCDPMGVDVAMSSGDGFELVRFDTTFLPSFVIGVDADGDGERDVVIWSRLGQIADYRLGLGGGAFEDSFAVQYSRGLSAQSCDRQNLRIRVADVEGDGQREMVVLGSIGAGPGDQRRIMLVPIGNGIAEPEDARFGRSWLPQTFTNDTRWISLTDPDADGDLDLLYVVGSDYFLCRFEDGLHQRPELFIDQSDVDGRATLADLEGDGVPDVVEPGGRFVGDFDDGWTATVLRVRSVRLDGSVELHEIDTDAVLNPGTESVVNVGDVDGDGRDDLAVGFRHGALVTGVLTEPVESPLRLQSDPGGAFGGRNEVLSFAQSEGPAEHVLRYPVDALAPGSQTFTGTADTFPAFFAGEPIDRPFRVGHMQAVDLDLDGRDELVVTDDPDQTSQAWAFTTDGADPLLLVVSTLGDQEVERAH
ncbi:MAG: hypothetical protein AAGA55_09505, partial [Planctomycetota bacterium]